MIQGVTLSTAERVLYPELGFTKRDLAEHLEQPDRIVFDLDPGEGVLWPQVVEAARLLRRELATLRLECWPKLTGGKGLHVVVPLQPEHGWEPIYTLSRKIAEAVAQRSSLFTLDFAKHRGGARS